MSPVKSQFSFGLSFQLGNNVVILTSNNPLAVKLPYDYPVEISQKLNDEGVKLLANGSVKFPKTESFFVIAVADLEFQRITVRDATKELLDQTISQAKNHLEELGNKLSDLLIKRVHTSSELGKLMLYFASSKVLKVAWTMIEIEFKNLKTKVDLGKAIDELAELAKEIPAPEPESAE